MLTNLRMTMLSGLATSFVRPFCGSFSSDNPRGTTRARRPNPEEIRPSLPKVRQRFRSMIASASGKAITAAIVVTTVVVLLPTCEAEAQTTIHMNGYSATRQRTKHRGGGQGKADHAAGRTSSCTTPPTSRGGRRALTARPSPTSIDAARRQSGDLQQYSTGVGIGHLERERPRRLLRD